MKFLKHLIQKPPAETLAAIELEDAKRDLLVAQNQLDYAASLAAYQVYRIKRLEEYLLSGNPVTIPVSK